MTAFCFWCWSGALFSFLLHLLFRNRDRKPIDKTLASLPQQREWFIEFSFYTGLVLCIGLTQYTTNYIFERMNVGCALALFQISSIISVFLGIQIFHEKHFLQKMIGTIIMMSGAFLILLFG